MDCFSRVLSLFSAPDVADICLPIFGLRAVLGVGECRTVWQAIVHWGERYVSWQVPGGASGAQWRSLYIQTTGRPAWLPPAQELSTTNIQHSKRLHRSPSHQGLMAPIFQLKYWATVSPSWLPSVSNFPCVWARVAVAAPDRVPLSHISEIITINTISPQPPACFRVARHSWWLSTHHQILHFPNDWKICPSPKRPKITGICGQYNPHISHLSTHIFSHTSERGRQQPAIICELFLY